MAATAAPMNHDPRDAWQGFLWRVAAANQCPRLYSRADVPLFHQLGRYKWERLKPRYAIQPVQPPASAEVEKAVGVFRNAGLDAF